MKNQIAIIGKGKVGSALARGLERGGQEVRTVGNDAAAVRQAGEWAGVILLAVPFAAIDAALGALGDGLAGKPLIDATNALTGDMQLALGFNTSGAEELQKKAPRARVVKAFNTVFAKNMATGQVKGQRLGAFVAGDDRDARALVLALATAIGFDAIDCGPLRNARWIEAMAYLNIQLGFAQEMGTEIGFALIH